MHIVEQVFLSTLQTDAAFYRLCFLAVDGVVSRLVPGTVRSPLRHMGRK